MRQALRALTGIIALFVVLFLALISVEQTDIATIGGLFVDVVLISLFVDDEVRRL